MTTMTATPTSTDWMALTTTVGESIRDDVATRDAAGELSPAVFDLLRSSGITAALVPAEFGGGGATHAEMGAILRGLARVDPSTAVTLSMHSHVLGLQVWRHHKGMDASAVFGKVVGGAVLLSTGASDWLPSNGTVTKVDGGYRVSARKAPISGAEVGNILATSFRWDDAPDGPSVIHCTVPTSAEGVSVDLTWDTLGLRATGSHTVVFEDVFVPDAAVSLVRPADVWAPIWNAIIPTAMPLIMAAYLGIADAAVDAAVATVAGRSDAHVVQSIGEMVNAHLRVQDAVTAMFADADNLQFANTDDIASRTLARKTTAAEGAIETVRLAIEATGGIGFSRRSEIERLYRDVHGSLFHPLPRAKQLPITGRVALGHSPV